MRGEFQEDNPTRYDLVIGFLQVVDLLLNISQTSNDDIMKELQKQNKEYLEKIVQQNEEMLELLKGTDK